MTRLPVESRDVAVADGPQFKVGPNCSTPGCTRYSDHAHHLVRRSFLGGDYAWVRMPDGNIVGNLAPLCWLHHQDVTENRVDISYDDGVFYWDNLTEERQPLTWQPPTQGTILIPVADNLVPEEHVHERPVCQTCGQKWPKPKIETPQEEKKVRKTWAVSVPVDELEDGADTLDALLEAARQELADAGMEYGAGKRVKFHILCTSLGLFVQHAKPLLSNE